MEKEKRKTRGVMGGPNGYIGMFATILIIGGFAGLLGVFGGKKVLIFLFPKLGDNNTKEEV
jgi:hypothetical protein